MNLDQIKNMLDWQFRVEGAELKYEYAGSMYFIAIDSDFKDAIEVKVHSADRELYSVYTRFHIEGVEIDETIEGVSDTYEFIGHLDKPLKAVFLG